MRHFGLFSNNACVVKMAKLEKKKIKCDILSSFFTVIKLYFFSVMFIKAIYLNVKNLFWIKAQTSMLKACTTCATPSCPKWWLRDLVWSSTWRQSVLLSAEQNEDLLMEQPKAQCLKITKKVACFQKLSKIDNFWYF